MGRTVDMMDRAALKPLVKEKVLRDKVDAF